MKQVWIPEKSEVPAVEVVNAQTLEELNAIAARLKQYDLALNRMRMDA
jgi:hypothetical protein